MIYQAKAYASHMKHVATGRKIFLSYPKSGRTWIVNVLMNYWYRISENIDEPLPFTVSSKDERFIGTQNGTGIIFTHGGKIDNLFAGQFYELSTPSLAHLNTTLLVRDPVDTLVSFYHHLSASREAVAQQDLASYLSGEFGYKPMARYYNHVLPHILKNDRALIVSYESLHPSSPDRFFRLAQIVFHIMGSVDREALLWADDACRIDKLKERSAGPTKRLRKGEKGASASGELSEDLESDVFEKFIAALMPDARAFFLSCYARSRAAT